MNKRPLAKPFFKQCAGQVMAEYVIVCLLVAMVLIYPFDGRPLFMLVVEALRSMHSGYMAGVSVYAYPF